jgi:hypothetical protein
MTTRRATFTLLPRLFFLLAFLCAATPSVPSFAEKVLPQREASLAAPGGISGSIVLRWSFGQKDFSKTKSELQAPQANLWRQTAPAVFVHDEPRVSYSPTIFGVSPSRSPPVKPAS